MVQGNDRGYCSIDDAQRLAVVLGKFSERGLWGEASPRAMDKFRLLLCCYLTIGLFGCIMHMKGLSSIPCTNRYYDKAIFVFLCMSVPPCALIEYDR